MSLFDGIPDTPRPKRAAATSPRESAGNKAPLPRTQMDAIEQGLVRRLQANVSFPPGSSHKRFINHLDAERSRLSDRGRAYLAYIANRYRRQWKPTHEEFCWIVQWASYGAIPTPKRDSQC
jgi:hypothetical protein